MRTLPGELLESRVRPVRSIYLRAATPPGVLAVWALLTAIVSLANWPFDGPTAPWTVALSMAPGTVLASIATRWTDTASFPPVLMAATAAMVVGVLAIPGPLGVLVLLAGALAWLGALDVVRAGTRIELTTHGVVVRAGWLARPGRFLYSDLHGVEAQRHRHHHWGALVLETEHGLFPIRGVPNVEAITDRVHTRMAGGAVPDEVEDVSGVAGRVKQLLEAGI